MWTEPARERIRWWSLTWPPRGEAFLDRRVAPADERADVMGGSLRRFGPGVEVPEVDPGEVQGLDGRTGPREPFHLDLWGDRLTRHSPGRRLPVRPGGRRDADLLHDGGRVGQMQLWVGVHPRCRSGDHWAPGGPHVPVVRIGQLAGEHTSRGL